MQIKLGIYKHFKGKRYLVIGVAKHSSTLELLVVYIPLYDNEESKMWVRPLSEFTDKVEVAGKKQPRFKFVSSYAA
jgi:hypothetical protein